jgi:hypothetical protein
VVIEVGKSADVDYSWVYFVFSLLVPPLETGVVEPYPVQGVWCPSRLPLEGTDHI